MKSDPRAAGPQLVLQVVGRGMNNKLLLRFFSGTREKPRRSWAVTFHTNPFTLDTHSYVSIMYLGLNIRRSIELTRTGAITSLQFVWPLDLSWMFFFCVYFSGVRFQPLVSSVWERRLPQPIHLCLRKIVYEE